MRCAGCSMMAVYSNRVLLFFFFQAEDGIRDLIVTGVQTCALPIFCRRPGVDAVEDVGRQGYPPAGSLPMAERRVLIEVLRNHTASPDRCWFCFRDRLLEDQGVTARAELADGGPFLLAGGPIEMALLAPPPRSLVPVTDRMMFTADDDDRPEPDGDTSWLAGPSPSLQVQSPNLWWPDDRAWFVATAPELDSSYLGGSRGLIEALV